MVEKVNLHDIYRSIGELTSAVRSIDEKVNHLREDMSDTEVSANASRAGIHRRLDELVLRVTNIEADVLSAKNRIDKVERDTSDMKTVTDDVRIMRERAFGAGALGVWLWRLGGMILSAAGGAAAAYTWLTGRPPT